MTDTTVTKAEKKRQFSVSALYDLLLIVGVLVGVKQTALLYSSQFAGPISTFTAMIVATWMLRRRGMAWADLGFVKPEKVWKMLLQAALVFGFILLFLAAGGFIADLFFDKGFVINRFEGVEGNVPVFIMWLFLVWTHSAFFEEMLFRAVIMNRLSTFFGGDTAATIAAIVLSSIFFGYRHAYYQGGHGFIVTGFAGLGFAIVYVVLGKKNLLPQILAHGTINTIGFTLRFLGMRD
ncbi:CPBP family intramembrane metalloprotease [Kordiimonas sp. SCSIO 12603]|uniref:CPBP family intramembrane glutamic endopeptidase n=1 Tax=Kordiimonas sp. SCSIO 12603 TaxID=2829596 RepID=UPI0021065ED6|nr:type II CAAX endopeptidase family protein [Kordiimonas sp. SCSIO 12603]UTW60112.1 CPBP family intramembrane metalloprotease [Kordiimonas sp. SCSIO 12603]